MELLVSEIAKGDEENVTSSLRTAIEVRLSALILIQIYLFNCFANCSVAGWVAFRIVCKKLRRKKMQKLIAFALATMAISSTLSMKC